MELQDNEFVLTDGDGAPRKVTLKRRIPLSLAPRLPGMMAKYGETGDVNDLVRVLVLVVESWEFDGQPSDPRAYAQLDIFSEILPMGAKAAEYVGRKLEYAGAKN